MTSLCRTMTRIAVSKRLLHSYQNQKFLVVTTKLFDSQQTQTLLDNVFESAWRSGIVEINALVYTTNASWSLITYFPYDSPDCTKLTYKTLATFTAGNFTRLADMPLSELYVRKMRNLRRCPIFVRVVPVEPYVFLPLKPGDQFAGIDIEIIEAIATALNFTAKFIVSDGHNVIYRNGTKEPNAMVIHTSIHNRCCVRIK